MELLQRLSHQSKWIFVVAFMVSVSTSMACHTPKRAAILDKQYPDWDLVSMMHAMHDQPYKGYNYRGVQNCSKGMADIYPCKKVDLMGHLDLGQIGGGQGADSWGWKDEASGRYFALVGRSNGTAFVEITDPTTPVYLGNLPTESSSSTWRDIKTYQGKAYIVADNLQTHGMQVFELSRLLNVNNAPETFAADQIYRGGSFEDAHNIVINEETGFAYLVGGATCEGGLHMVDLKTMPMPTFAGCFSDDGYTHDAQCINYKGPDKRYTGKEICFASNEDTVTVVNVSNKSNPVQISRTGYTGSQYTHQGWLTEDQRYFVIDDELDEFGASDNNTRTIVMDFNDLLQPSFRGFYEADGPSIDHNQYIKGNFTFQANYTRGLRILRFDDLSQARMTEVAFFDTYPEADSSSGFSGAWNVYPFFDNGLVLISDINRGIFILQPDLSEANPDIIFADGFE